MQINQYLRFSMTLQDNQASTLYMNLIKLIALVIYDSKADGLNIYEIIESIKRGYELEFTDIEVINAIKVKGAKKIILLEKNIDPVYSTYGLHPSEQDRLENQESNLMLDEILEECIEKNPEIDCDLTYLKHLIIKFFYGAFNTNKEIILSLINKNHAVLDNEYFSDLTNQEKIYINTFLSWENGKKYSLVFNAISCCFEYCMMAIKKDYSAYHDIFRGKIFYLDANIIFRLTGINKHERKQIMLSFIERCKGVGIGIRYTNITLEEIKSTINYYVDGMEKLLGSNEPISTAAISRMSLKYANLEFYDEYTKWLKKSSLNKPGDYRGFKEYFFKMVEDVLSEFKFEAYESYENSTDSRKFNDLCQDFKSYKLRKYKNTYDGSIKADINNYLFLQKKNNSIGSKSFIAVKHYMITADHSFTDWSKQRIVSTIPTVVLPSVWHSIILKYSGRSPNDYKAFSQFLVLRLSEGNETKDNRRREILDIVMHLNESPKIKEEIIFDIDRKLLNEYKEIESVEEIVEIAHQYITEENVKKAVSQKEEEYKEEILNQFSAGNSSGYENGFKAAINEVEQNLLQTVNSNTEIEMKWRYPLYIIITVLLTAVFLAIYCSWMYYIMSLEKISANFEVCSDYIVLLFECAYAVIFVTIIAKAFKGLRRKKIREEVYKKHYDNIITPLKNEPPQV